MGEANDRERGAQGPQPESREAPATALPPCPNCDSALLPRSCKIRCPRCGYFEDCSNLI